MLINQKSACAICGKTEKIRLGVDHCHKTNAIRALLCGRCNRMIGLAEEDANLLGKAMDYLKKFTHRSRRRATPKILLGSRSSL
jgi:hypothetical protein